MTAAHDTPEPCPFCGASNIGYYEVEGKDNHSFECLECFAEISPQRSRAAALAAWNRRAPLAAEPPELRRLHCRVQDLEAQVHGAQERCHLLFEAKNHWAEKARALEAAQAQRPPAAEQWTAEEMAALQIGNAPPLQLNRLHPGFTPAPAAAHPIDDLALMQSVTRHGGHVPPRNGERHYKMTHATLVAVVQDFSK